MSRVLGRSKKITKNQARGYGYTNNPGVTTIAAINGRGAFAARRSARSVMSKLKKNARVGHARRRLSSAEKEAFKKRMAMARNTSPARRLAPNRSTSSAQSAASRSNIKKAQRSRKAWGRKIPRGKRVRVGRAAFGSKPKARRLKAGVYIANRRKKAGAKTTMARRRKKASSGATKKRRSTKRRRKSTTKAAAAPKRRRRRKVKKAATKSKRRVSRRRRKAAPKLKANRRRRRIKKNAAPKRRRRKATSRRRTRKTSRKRGSARRKTRKSSRRRRSSKKLTANRRRRHRRNPRKRMASNRRRKSSGRRRSHRKNKGHKKNRRRHRRNGRKLFRMNGVTDFLKLGAMLFGGFALHRLASNMLDRYVLARLMPAPAVVAPTSGFDLQSNRGLIASVLTGAAGGFIASKVIKNAETKKLIIGGMVASVFHGVVVSLLKSFMPSGADMLAGPEDGTAARLSAMYGLRGGESIMPRYAAIGEYFREPMNGLGEYFREPAVSGIGEYIAATNGLGTYEANGDLYQAAAGMGAQEYQGNHIDPSGDLDRQLTIAEAAAGVGALSPFEAAAGVMPFEASAGMGAIESARAADTWIPGTSDPQLWAGVKAVSAGQSATEMTPAGVLQTDGGQGIFG